MKDTIVLTKPFKIASLACSYNRKDKTIRFLKSVFSQTLPEGYSLDVYLLDDNSTDGTPDFVRQHFPDVTIIEGTGSLYWAGGMRNVWRAAMTNYNYDFFLLLNDDVNLADNAISRLLAAHERSGTQKNILLGTVVDTEKQTITYGGHQLRNKITGFTDRVVPDELELREAQVGNANVMLVDKGTVDKIGILSDEYVHGLADYDYTLRGIKNGVKVWVAPGYYGDCINDHGRKWLQGSTPLKKRIAYLYSPTGLAYREYLHYVWKHFPLMLPTEFIKAWLKTLFPVFYYKFKN